MNYRIHYSDELYHYGVKGMKWGVRKEYESKGRKEASSTTSEQKKARAVKAVKIGAAVAVTALAAYGAYKAYDAKVPKTIVVEKTIRKQTGHWPGKPNLPWYSDVKIQETIPNPNRKFFKIRSEQDPGLTFRRAAKSGKDAFRKIQSSKSFRNLTYADLEKLDLF